MTKKRSSGAIYKPGDITGHDGFYKEVASVYGKTMYRVLKYFFVIPEGSKNIVVVRNYINKHISQLSDSQKYGEKIIIEDVTKTRKVIRLSQQTINELKDIGESYGIKVLTQKEYLDYLSKSQANDQSGNALKNA